jgi:hypothetical protein
MEKKKSNYNNIIREEEEALTLNNNTIEARKDIKQVESRNKVASKSGWEVNKKYKELHP